MASISDNSTLHIADHGDADLLCRTSWSSTLVFYLVNYLAHCATVKPYPGEPTFEIALAVIYSLFFPSSGVIRAFDSIGHRTRLCKTNKLQRAAQAGALCMVVRSDNRSPQPDDHIIGSTVVIGDGTSKNKAMLGYGSWHREPRITYLPEVSIIDRGCKIHGIYSLPRGYELDYVPSDVKLHKHLTNISVSISLASTYNLPKTSIAILQAIYSGITLAWARGNQVRIYGYASFGLTVIPYLVMSLLNLLRQLVTPDYPALYLVDNPEMTEAKRRGGIFEGVVGSLVLPERSKDIEEWTVEAASFEQAETETDNGNEPGPSQIRATTLSQDVELSNLSSASTSLVLREKIPEGGDARSLHLGLLNAHLNTNLEETFGYKIIIPRCSPYQRLCLSNDPEKLQTYSCSEHPEDRAGDRGTVLYYSFPVSLISLLVNGALSHFQKGSSTLPQRAWIMSWLVLGIVIGPFCISHPRIANQDVRHIKKQPRFVVTSLLCAFIGWCLFFGIFFAPAIGGLVVVGQMLSYYGNCERI